MMYIFRLNTKKYSTGCLNQYFLNCTCKFPLLPFRNLVFFFFFFLLSTAPKCQNKPPPILTIRSFREKGRTGKISSTRSEDEILSSPNVKALSFSELKTATRNFRPDSLLGEGGFGYVYKGWLVEQTLTAARPGSGIVVAVKKLKPQGFQGHKEWLVGFSYTPLNSYFVFYCIHLQISSWLQSEVNYLGQLHHPNLVKLIGYCLDGDNRLLVYEFMARGSLENHLFKS